MMRSILQRLLPNIKRSRDENGHVFVLTLILLALCGLIVVPVLAYANTGLKANKVYEERTDELYAADAGVNHALWSIKHNVAGLPSASGSPALEYDVTDDVTGDPLTVNGKPVHVTITYSGTATYAVVSRGGSAGDNESIEAEVSVLDFGLFMNNAITSPTEITLQPGTQITGDVQVPEDGTIDNKGTINGSEEYGPIASWPRPPSYGGLSEFYLDQVNTSNPFGSDTIDVATTPLVPAAAGPAAPDGGTLYLYREGNLTFTNSIAGRTATLQGTVYVDGNLSFAQSGSKDYNINLAGNTIFVTGSITLAAQHVDIIGPGCIIAMGPVVYQPGVDSSGFIFIMSITSYVTLKPLGNFVGSVAGETEVTLQPQCRLTWVEPPPNLNYPQPDQQDRNVLGAIDTWEIQ